MSFITEFICPNRTFSGLSFPPPVPLDLDGPYAILARPDLCNAQSTGAGHPLAFPTSIHSALHRNWKPYNWDVLGSAVGTFEGAGYAMQPGIVGGTDPIFFDYYTGSLTAEWDGIGGTGRIPNPNFAIATNVRTMISWSGLGDGFNPDTKLIIFEDFFPLFWDENGLNTSGWYIVAEFKVYGVLEPYYWFRGGSYYLEHEIRVDCRMFCTPTPGQEPPENWNPVEGAYFNKLGGDATSRDESEDRNAVGIARISDTTGADPNPGWGSVTMWGEPQCPVDLNLRVRSNFLPFPE